MVLVSPILYAEEPYDGTSGNNLYSYTCEPSGKHISQTDTANSVTTYPFRSPRSDVLALTDTTGSITQTFAYEPFGEMEEGYTQEGTPFLYQDDYLDESTSLYQMQARWYDPSTSLFTSQDPQMGDASDPSLRSPYAYCADDPVFNSDPSGKSWWDFLKACQNPVIGSMMRNNPALAMAILGIRPTSRGSSGGNSRRIGTKSGISSLAPRQAPDRPSPAPLSPFNPFDVLGKLSQAQEAPGAQQKGSEAQIMAPSDPFEGKDVIEISNIMKASGQLKIPEEIVVDAIEAHFDKQATRDALLQYYYDAKAGWYSGTSTWSQLFTGETWRKAAPGILKGISLAFAITAAVGSFGMLAAPVSAFSAVTIGGTTITAGGLTTASVATSILADEASKSINFVRIYNAYQRKEITGEEARNLAGYNTLNMLLSGVAPNFLTPAGGVAVSQSMDAGFKKMLELYKNN